MTHEEKLEELLELEEGLTAWEAKFVSDVDRQLRDARMLSGRQLETIDRIYRERIEDV